MGNEDDMKKWNFTKNKWEKDGECKDKKLTVREAMGMLMAVMNKYDNRQVVPLCRGDPSSFPCFRPDPAAEDAVVEALKSARFNGYVTNHYGGLPQARKAVAEYVSKDLPYRLSENDVFLTGGCKQAIHATLSAFAGCGSNILLPMPSFSMYDSGADFTGLEVRHYDLLPEKGWEVDLDSLQDVADHKTVAMVIINPGNPTGSVYSHQHLQQVAETAAKLGLIVISDEVYGHTTFGRKPFVRMGVFATTVPVLTLGSISKRWLVPGWRLGWLITTDPHNILQQSELINRVKSFLAVASDPPTFIQAAIPAILEKTRAEFFSNAISILLRNADNVYEKLKDIPSISCPNKPEGSMFVMVKLDVTLLDGVTNDVDFCQRLAKEEKVLLLPGSTLGMENWLRITFSVEPSILEDGLERMKSFCQRNSKVEKTK